VLLLGCAQGQIDLPPDDMAAENTSIIDERTAGSGREFPGDMLDTEEPGPRGQGTQCEQSNDVGSCDGDLVTRCVAGFSETIDCEIHGRTCGLVNAQIGMGCIFKAPDTQPPSETPPNSPPPPDECQGVTSTGQCDGDVMVRCLWNNELETQDCSSQGLVCGWDGVGNRWGCIAGEAPELPEPEEPIPPVPQEPPMDVGCGLDIEREVVMMANGSRAQNGAGQLTCDGALTLAARRHSEDMCARSYFSHTGQDGSSAGDRMRRTGAEFRSWAENIAQGYGSADQVHTGWMNSAGHRRNLLNPGLGRIGVGYAECNGRPYWTQVFAD
jgi:uncharacterized protein YkwD